MGKRAAMKSALPADDDKGQGAQAENAMEEECPKGPKILGRVCTWMRDALLGSKFQQCLYSQT